MVEISNFFQGFHQKDIGLFLAVLMAVWLCPTSTDAQECGENPMKEIFEVAKRTGQLLKFFCSNITIFVFRVYVCKR